MGRHVRLLGILVWLWGALGGLVGVSMLLLADGALALSEQADSERLLLATGISAAVFASIGVFALLWGLVHIWTSALLHRRAGAGRVLMLGLGLVNILVFPFGTGLGVYAFWVLLTHEGRELFQVGGVPPSESALP
ncbi:MAG: hypothetical protein O2930_04315 [Acidobacteria bacterium]|nr:hypothetical protein [Acidobacteriota bacterium]